MKTVLVIVATLLIALYFERARLSAFFARRRGPPPAWHSELISLRRRLQDDEGVPHLAFAETVDGIPWRYLFAWSGGDIFLRASGPDIRYRFLIRNRAEPLWLDRAAPLPPEREHGPHRDTAWVFNDPREGWAPVQTASGQAEAGRLFETFRAVWTRHIDPGLRPRREADWAATVAAFDAGALERLLTLLARGDTEAVRAGVTAAREALADTPWAAVPDTAEDRALLWWWEAIRPLDQAELLFGIDWKGFDDGQRAMLLAPFPALADLAGQPEPEVAAPDALLMLDAAIRPRGYRLLSAPVPDDSYQLVILPEDEAREAETLASRLGISLRPAE